MESKEEIEPEESPKPESEPKNQNIDFTINFIPEYGDATESDSKEKPEMEAEEKTETEPKEKKEKSKANEEPKTVTKTQNQSRYKLLFKSHPYYNIIYHKKSCSRYPCYRLSYSNFSHCHNCDDDFLCHSHYPNCYPCCDFIYKRFYHDCTPCHDVVHNLNTCYPLKCYYPLSYYDCSCCDYCHC